jgi:hypothetical protein
MATSAPNSPGSFPFIFSLALSGGSLLTYLAGALVSRFLYEPRSRSTGSFNLGVPNTSNPHATFAMSLAAAQTTLSTVFVAFLTDAGSLGFHLLYCPLAFAFGNWFMLRGYKRLLQNGYIDASAWSGLLPHYFFLFTRSRTLTKFITILCALVLAVSLPPQNVSLSQLL